jgi:hypothetical protein
MLRRILTLVGVLVLIGVAPRARAECKACVWLTNGGGFCSILTLDNPGNGNTTCYNLEFGCTYTVPGNPPGESCSVGCDPRCRDQQG